MNKSQAPSIFRLIEHCKTLFIIVIGILFFLQLYRSLEWPIVRDAGFLHYIGYLINEHDYLPYVDIFDVNMPGTYLFHMAIGEFLGYSSLAFRLVDCTWLMLTLVATWFFMKPFGRLVAFGACFLFGHVYLQGTIHYSLQREFIILLPLLLALLITFRIDFFKSTIWPYLFQGALLGIVAVIKPHLAIGLPVIIVFNHVQLRKKQNTKWELRPLIKGGIYVIIGFGLALIGPFIWLWQIGALPSFLEISSKFSPIYLQMTGDVRIEKSRLGYLLINYFKLGKIPPVIAAGILGILIAIKSLTLAHLKQRLYLILACLLCYSIYVILGGKFWGYHWLPFNFFLCLCASLLLLKTPTIINSTSAIVILGVVLLVFSSGIIFKTANKVIYPEVMQRSYNERHIEIADYLATHLQTDETVQPLDWISGAIDGMLEAKVPVATPFICDFQFYFPLSYPYIRTLRSQFLSALEQAKPTLFIDTYDKHMLSGEGVPEKFVELKAFISQYYLKVYSGNGFDIYRVRKD